MVDSSKVRGVRNCNPLNIERGTKWKGLRPEQTDKRFCQFVSMQYGWRAGLVILRNYIKGNNAARKPFDTIEKIINRWAPPKENNTSSYIKAVCEDVGIDMRTRIKWEDRAAICAIVKAMARVECNVIFDIEPIYAAYDMIS